MSVALSYAFLRDTISICFIWEELPKQYQNENEKSNKEIFIRNLRIFTYKNWSNDQVCYDDNGSENVFSQIEITL
jgi:hypothetical protein